MILAAALAAGAAWWLLAGGRAWAVRLRLGRRAGPPRSAVFGWVGVLAIVLAVAGGIAPVVQLITALGVLGFVLRTLRRARDRRAARALRDASGEVVEALAGELWAGASPVAAVERLADQWDFLGGVAMAARLGGDVPAALRSIGVRALDETAAAWRLAEQSGAPLGAVLDRVAAAVAEAREAHREIEASLAPARVTAYTLALLPVFGVALGTSMGYDPLGVLLHSGVGAVCLALGAAFACAGIAWVDRVAHRAEAV